MKPKTASLKDIAVIIPIKKGVANMGCKGKGKGGKRK